MRLSVCVRALNEVVSDSSSGSRDKRRVSSKGD